MKNYFNIKLDMTVKDLDFKKYKHFIVQLENVALS